jgi:FtsP/CotA-like multicopper oxidase with cupredoxin domain
MENKMEDEIKNEINTDKIEMRINCRSFVKIAGATAAEVTTIIMKFDLPNVPFTVPQSPRTGGNEYVWHCHILEHEEHDMMRPIVVT